MDKDCLLLVPLHFSSHMLWTSRDAVTASVSVEPDIVGAITWPRMWVEILRNHMMTASILFTTCWTKQELQEKPFRMGSQWARTAFAGVPQCGC